MITETIKLGVNSIVDVVKSNPKAVIFAVGFFNGVTWTIGSHYVIPVAQRFIAAAGDKVGKWTAPAAPAAPTAPAAAPKDMEVDENGTFVPA